MHFPAPSPLDMTPPIETQVDPVRERMERDDAMPVREDERDPGRAPKDVAQACAEGAVSSPPTDAHAIHMASAAQSKAMMRMLTRCLMELRADALLASAALHLEVWRLSAQRSREEADTLVTPFFTNVVAEGWQTRLDDKKRWAGGPSRASLEFRDEDELEESPGSSMEVAHLHSCPIEK